MGNEDSLQPLREDIRFLGATLGDVIRQIDGEKTFELVEHIRKLSIRARLQDQEAVEECRSLLRELPTSTALVLARAFSQFLLLANIAEQYHRIRRKRFYENVHKHTPQRASFRDSFVRLKDAGIGAEEILSAIKNQRIDLVLTAHPTEVLRPGLIRKYNRIAQGLALLDRQDRTWWEDHQARSEIKRQILAAWKTQEIRPQKPTPINEARTGLAVVEEVLWDSLPETLRRLDYEMKESLGVGLDCETVPIRFGSWMGGDRDGNPSVTAEITKKVVRLSRQKACQLYRREIDKLIQELTMHNEHPGESTSPEPFRAYLRKVKRRLLATHNLCLNHNMDPSDSKDGYDTAEDLREDLLDCFRDLHKAGLGEIANGRLRDLIWRTYAFKLCLLPLDIRQESTVHEAAVTEVFNQLQLGDYGQMTEKERVDHLLAFLGSGPSTSLQFSQFSEETQEVLNTAALPKQLSAENFGSYIISMAESVSDLLEVAFLQKVVCGEVLIPVVPLFETVDDLDRAPQVMSEYFRIPWVRSWISGEQQIMVGYSDSSKRSGKVASAWSLYQTQVALAKLAKEHSIDLVIFHGRGGSVGRGGGPTYLALRAQPPGSISGRIRVTEQGESIQGKFGLPSIALRTCELYFTGTLESSLLHTEPEKESWHNLMDEIASLSSEDFRSSIYENESFISYFTDITPEALIGELNISSRPKKRKKKGGFESLRAIPWVFAWTQTRSMLPSWLGFGRSIQAMIEKGHQAEIRKMYKEWPFFQSIVDLIEMVLSKADMGVFQFYTDELATSQEQQKLTKKFQSKYQQSVDALLQVTQHKELLENNPVLSRSIALRNPYVDPINFLQAILIERLRENPDDVDLKQALLITINGVAAGMRNTG